MNDPDIIKEFLVESHENLDRLDRDLVALEKEPRDRQRLASIFRTIHTIKGTCGFLGFSQLGTVTHAGENLLGRLRDGQLVLNADITSALLALVDAVRKMLARIETTGAEGEGNYQALISTLNSLSVGKCAPAVASSPQQDRESAGMPSQPPAEPSITTLKSTPHKLDAPAQGGASFAGASGPSAGVAGDALEEPQKHGARSEADVETVTSSALSPASLETISDSTIRVHVDLLHKLMRLVGELVLTRNQILRFTAAQKDSTFLGTCQHLNLITTELQEAVMKTRMQPIANIWKKFPRVVRDLALACGKQVRIEMEGKETELDKTLIEAIRDPLTHVVRNAIDHGIETPEARKTRGKPAEGRLSLRAFHEGGQVNIEVADDGAGLDLERIKHKALERSLLTSEQAVRMSGRELLQLIYLPGFSTAEKITSISGRGVGMDVVKTNIEKIGGTVDIQSELGQGTTVKLKIPLTLAIIPALIVTSVGDRYAIPRVSVLELIRLEGERGRRSIERIHGCLVYRLRGNLLPLVHLDDALGVQSQGTTHNHDTVNLVVLQADGRHFGLVVEGVTDTEEIVVKPLGKHLKRIPLFAGATIMGDGKVVLILDILGLAQRARVVSEGRNDGRVDRVEKKGTIPATPKGQPSLFPQTLLLVALGTGHRLAIPLSLVTRLEEIPLSAVEKTAGQEVIQYRDRILPLIDLAAILEDQGPPRKRAATRSSRLGSVARKDPLQLVVYSEREQSVGLVVDRILDTVETTVALHSSAARPGILGTAVIEQRITDLLDLPALLHNADPSLAPERQAENGERRSERCDTTWGGKA